MGKLAACGFRTIDAILLFCLMAALATGQPFTSQHPANISEQGEASPVGETMWVKANGLRLKTDIHRSPRLSSHPILVVVLHGDLLGVRSIPSTTYHYVFAQHASAKMDDLVAVAVLRPGYRDASGEHSDGEQWLTTGDNYTPEVVDAVAQAIDQLKAKFHPSHTVLAGHSGVRR